jgi:hypothetical protein
MYDYNATKRKALPPSPIGTSSVGSGFLSRPEIKQECMVAEDENEPIVQILTYTTTRFTNPFGGLTGGEKIAPGGFAMKIGGANKSVLSMEPGGVFGLFSNAWAHMGLYGEKGEYNLVAKTLDQRTKVGTILETYNPSDNRSSYV